MSQRAAASRIALVPFVVERISVSRAPLEELARRGADVEAVDAHRVSLAADERVRDARAQGARLVDLPAAENALVARTRAPARSSTSPAGRRRRCPPERTPPRRRERDVDTHPTRLDRIYCYRHPEPRDRPLVHRVRAAHLHRMPADDARRARAVPTTRRRGSRRSARPARAAQRRAASRTCSSEQPFVTYGADRRQRRRLPDHRRAGRRDQQRPAASSSRSGCSSGRRSRTATGGG